MFQIFGYGAGVASQSNGVLMGTGYDEAYTKCIVEALANQYKGQWFGYSEQRDNGRIFSDPVRFKLETSK
jgi:hypothetical protein